MQDFCWQLQEHADALTVTGLAIRSLHSMLLLLPSAS